MGLSLLPPMGARCIHARNLVPPFPSYVVPHKALVLAILTYTSRNKSLIDVEDPETIRQVTVQFAARRLSIVTMRSTAPRIAITTLSSCAVVPLNTHIWTSTLSLRVGRNSVSWALLTSCGCSILPECLTLVLARTLGLEEPGFAGRSSSPTCDSQKTAPTRTPQTSCPFSSPLHPTWDHCSSSILVHFRIRFSLPWADIRVHHHQHRFNLHAPRWPHQHPAGRSLRHYYRVHPQLGMQSLYVVRRTP